MEVVLDGGNATIPGQATVSSRPTSAVHVTRRQDVGKLRVIVTGLNLNDSAPVDLTSLDLSLSSKYLPTEIRAFDATADLSSAELGIYTEAAAAGTAIVAPAALTNLTAAGKYHDLTIAALTDLITSNTLYPRLTVAAGTAGTASLLLVFTVFD